MEHDQQVYDKTQLNSIGRQKERAKYDKVRSVTLLSHFLSPYAKETIATIVRESKILHVAFVDEDGMPQCVPMIGALEDNDAGDLILFLHGESPSSRLLPLTEVVSCPSGHPSSRIYKRLSQPDVRLVATGTILDGYVLALSSFGTSMNYRSAVLHGYTLPLGKQAGENPDEAKTKAFARIAERTVPGRWEHARKPTPTEFKGTAVVRVMIDSAR